MDEPHEDAVKSARQVADTLEQRGHAPQAAAMRGVLGSGRAGALLLEALRDVCQTVLTAIEAIDPVCDTLVEELRLEVDKRLQDHSKA
jgi:hypothetical protein